MLASARDRVTRRQRARRERGAVLVEAAIIMPLILMLVFGIIEYSFAFQGRAVLDDAARAGGRTAATLGGQPDYEEAVADAAAAQIRKLPGTAHPSSLLIYRANSQGYPGAEGVDGFTAVGNYVCIAWKTCTSMPWDPDEETFILKPVNLGLGGGPQDLFWDPSDGDLCNQGRVGVAVFAQYDPLLTMFDPVLERHTDNPANWNPLESHTVLAFEPKPTAICGA